VKTVGLVTNNKIRYSFKQHALKNERAFAKTDQCGHIYS